MTVAAFGHKMTWDNCLSVDILAAREVIMTE